ncbi:MAG: CPBP family intramembrane glutamic endopeptidase [bacterium]
MTYFVLNVAWIGLIQLGKRSGLGATPTWLLQHLIPPLVIIAVAWVIARRLAVDGAAKLLGLGRPVPAVLVIALVSGLPAVAIVLWHVVDQSWSWLLAPKAAALTLKILLNQGVFEEVMARGLLLGWLLLGAGAGAGAMSARRALWVSSIMFGWMHLLQFLLPPYTAERLINGLALVVLTIPIGAVFAWLTLRARSIWPAIALHFLIDPCILPQKLAHPNHALIIAGSFIPIALAPLLLHLHNRRRDRIGTT